MLGAEKSPLRSINDRLTAVQEQARRQGAPNETVQIWNAIANELAATDASVIGLETFGDRLLFELLSPRLSEPGIESLLLRAFHLIDGLRQESSNTRALIDDVAKVTVAEDAERTLVDLLSVMLEQVPPREELERRFGHVVNRELFDLRPLIPHAIPTSVVAIAPRVVVVSAGPSVGFAIALCASGDSRLLGQCCPERFVNVEIPAPVATAALVVANKDEETAISQAVVGTGFAASVVKDTQRLRIQAFGDRA